MKSYDNPTVLCFLYGRHGRCVYVDGSEYLGDWSQDQRHGWGVFHTADGQQYEGEWRDNMMSGNLRVQRLTLSCTTACALLCRRVSVSSSSSTSKASNDASRHVTLFKLFIESIQNVSNTTYTCAIALSPISCLVCCDCLSPGQGQWTFADGESHYIGTYHQGERVRGKLVMKAGGYEYDGE